MRFGTVLLVSIFTISGGTPATDRPNRSERVIKHVKVYAENGRYGGWPANYGIWSWGDEILVGFSAGYFKDLGPDLHNIDRSKPEEHLLARTLDGGENWTIENPAAKARCCRRERPCMVSHRRVSRRSPGQTARAGSTLRIRILPSRCG